MKTGRYFFEKGESAIKREGLGGKDLLGLQGVPRDEIELILDSAEAMKEILARDIKKVPTLRGKSIVCLFYEPSTRTRTSFELAGKYMSADTVNIAAASSSVAKGESLIDTGRTIEAMGVDMVVLRHSAAGAPHLLAREISASVINAGDGFHEHPTQALLDMFTIRDKKGTISDLVVTILGDIYHSRVARSNIWGLTTMGAVVKVYGPPTLIPPEVGGLGVHICGSMEEALEGSDVVNVLRIQKERQAGGLLPSLREYARLYGLTGDRVKIANDDVLVLHPGPVNRGIEITPDIMACEQTAVEEQVTNGVAVRMALMYLLMRGGSNIEAAG